MDENLIQNFGIAEMYEWKSLDAAKLGRFVQFDNEVPNKIVLYGNNKNPIIGVSTVNSVINSDDPEHWKYAYMCNEFGDTYLQKERLAVGQKQYDQLTEMNYIKTYPWEHYIPILNKYYNPNQKYVKRSVRSEWAKVNLMGKTVIQDNGKCEPGKFCMPYNGKLKEDFGTAVPATEKAKIKYYVLERLSANTILILNK